MCPRSVEELLQVYRLKSGVLIGGRMLRFNGNEVFLQFVGPSGNPGLLRTNICRCIC